MSQNYVFLFKLTSKRRAILLQRCQIIREQTLRRLSVLCFVSGLAPFLCIFCRIACIFLHFVTRYFAGDPLCCCRNYLMNLLDEFFQGNEVVAECSPPVEGFQRILREVPGLYVAIHADIVEDVLQIAFLI